MEKDDKQQICFIQCSNLGTFLPIIMVLVLFSFFFFFSISKSFPFLLTIPIALLSTIFLVTLRKKKGCLYENLVQDKLQNEEPQPSLDINVTEVSQQSETAESHELQTEAHSDYSFPSDSESSNLSVIDETFELNAQEHEYEPDFQSDSSLPSDSESSIGSIIGQSFEIDHNGNQNVSSSDGLASNSDDDDEEEEEDSLIEINLPSNNLCDIADEPKQTLESKLPDLLAESILKGQRLMELLAEINDMNEDENLIEIDISVGSTNTRDFI